MIIMQIMCTPKMVLIIHKVQDMQNLLTFLISLVIRRVNDDGSFSVVHRPQAYLNEAKITMIALSIRFSLLHDSKPPYAGQFLALDDLLISLDMSNREKVLEAILNVYAKKYKIYLFTHERSFFNLVKRRIDYGGNISEWEIREIYQITKMMEFPARRLSIQRFFLSHCSTKIIDLQIILFL